MYNKIQNESAATLPEPPIITKQSLNAINRDRFPSKGLNIFDSKEEVHPVARRAYQTISNIKPRLEIRGKNDPTKAKANNQHHGDTKEPIESLRDKLDAILDKKMYSWQQEHLKLMHTPSFVTKAEEEESSTPEEHLQKETEGRVSPYAQFYSTTLPKKYNKRLSSFGKGDVVVPPTAGRTPARLTECIAQIEHEYLKKKMPPVTNSANALLIKEIDPPPRLTIKKKEVSVAKVEKSGLVRMKPWVAKKKKATTPGKVSPGKDNAINNDTDHVYYSKLYSYLTFLTKVNFSNGHPVSHLKLGDRPSNFIRVKVFVGGGNNRQLLIALLKRRFWLEVTPKITADTKFVWTQNSMKEIHYRQASKPPSIRTKINTLRPETDSHFFNFTKRRSPS